MTARPMTCIGRASECDARLLPDIERSSGEIFRRTSGLAWIADDDVQSEQEHRALIADGVAFIAELQGHGVVAFLNAEVMPDALHIWQMAVHRAHQRRGIGRELIEAAEIFATKREIDVLTLTTFREVPWNEPYYQKLGFITLEREELGPRLSAVLDNEGRAGLPTAQRCAMRKALSRP